ncbi:MAG: UbiD family decarboxylase [Planctomycetota bacterium]
MIADLRAFIEILRREGEIIDIDVEVRPHLEVAEIHRRVIAAGGPALLFHRVQDSDGALVTNLFGTKRRVDLAFGQHAEKTIAELSRLPEELMPPSLGKLWGKRGLWRRLAKVGLSRSRRAPVAEVVQSEPKLTRLPALTTWPEDGGPFITLPLVYTEHPETKGHNLGMYRAQIFNDRETGMHFQIGKGGGHHLAVAEAKGEALPAAIIIGGPPALILGAIAPLPENVPELMLASLVLGKKIAMLDRGPHQLAVPANAEYVLSGEIPAGLRQPEGPFGDHYGYYSLRHDYPVFRCAELLKRKDAIFPATVVGKPRQEDFFIGDYLQEMLSPLFPVVMPQVIDLWSYGETGYHSLAAAVVRERFGREAMAAAFRILGEGQLALTKFLLVTDQRVDLKDFAATLECVLERADLRSDLYVFANLSMDTLDYTGPEVNLGSKGVLLGVGEKKRDLSREFKGPLPAGCSDLRVFCGGCLVVSGPSYEGDPAFAEVLTGSEGLADWPMVVLVDDAEKATRSAVNFLWTTFTRFEPAADMFTKSEAVLRHHRVFEAPLVIDARLKPNYPKELFADPETASLVSRRWKEYFPAGLEMGDSDAAHLD